MCSVVNSEEKTGFSDTIESVPSCYESSFWFGVPLLFDVHRSPLSREELAVESKRKDLKRSFGSVSSTVLALLGGGLVHAIDRCCVYR